MIFFFYGPNSYEARQQLARLESQYRQKTGSDLGLERVDGAKVSFGDLKSILQAEPFLASSRLVIIEGLGANKAVAPKAQELVRSVPDSTVAVFYEPLLDQRTVYAKTMLAGARVVEFSAPSTAKLHRWVEQEAGRLGATIERAALGRLLELAGDDQWRLSGEIAKLANLDPIITPERVSEMVESSQSESVFTLIESMTAGRSRQALAVYHQLLREGQNENYILNMIIWQLRNLLLAKVAGKISPPQLAKQGGMAPFVASKVLTRRHLFTEEQLRRDFLRAVDTDYQIKTGTAPADVLVEQLVVKLSRQAAAA